MSKGKKGKRPRKAVGAMARGNIEHRSATRHGVRQGVHRNHGGISTGPELREAALAIERGAPTGQRLFFPMSDWLPGGPLAAEPFSLPGPGQGTNGAFPATVHALNGYAQASAALLDVAWDREKALPSWKRALDLVVASAAILVLSPLMLLMAVGIKALSVGPVFFCQERVGYRGQRFLCIKFRSMHHEAETGEHRRYLDKLRTSNQPMAKLDSQNDRRLIPMGRLMRAMALDELPQLLNVLRGDMSMVGPRPAIPYEYEGYEAWQKLRFCSVPGMTGLWQVTGKNHTTFSEMLELDTNYAVTKSFWLDVKILVLTPKVLVGQVAELLQRKKGVKT